MLKKVALAHGDSPFYLVKKCIDLLGGINKFVHRGNKVTIKPNIFSPSAPGSGAITNIEVVKAICMLVHEAGGIPIIAEGSGAGYNSITVFKATGYSELSKNLGIELIDLNKDDFEIIKVPNPSVIKNFKIAKTILDTDVLINVPVMKTHMMTGVSLSLKNLKGVLPGKEKLKTHLTDLDRGIVDLNKIVKADITIMDATIGMEGNGPTTGTPIKLNAVVAGDDGLAVDFVSCKLMGINPTDIMHIKLAIDELGSVSGDEDIELVGDPLTEISTFFKRPDHIKPSFSRYNMVISHSKAGHFLLKELGISDTAQNLFNKFNKIYRKNKILIQKDKCKMCRACINSCPRGAIHIGNNKISISSEECVECMVCIEMCKYGAICVR